MSGRQRTFPTQSPNSLGGPNFNRYCAAFSYEPWPRCESAVAKSSRLCTESLSAELPFFDGPAGAAPDADDPWAPAPAAAAAAVAASSAASALKTYVVRCE